MRIGFASSSWTGLWIILFPPALSTSSNPTPTSFGLRWTLSRRHPNKWSISKTPRCSSRSQRIWGFEAFFTRITGPPARNWLRSEGEKKEEKEEKKKDYHLSERRYGAFQRSFTVPDGIDADKIDATFKDGILTVSLPKTAEAQKKEKQITIKKG
jgi:hypothetical protein